MSLVGGAGQSCSLLRCPGASRTATITVPTAIPTNTIQARRHRSPAAMAIGPAMTTPQLVPELIVDQARGRRRGCAHGATRSAYGENARPAAATDTRTPTASAGVLGAPAITLIQAAASTAARPIAACGPHRLLTQTRRS